MVAKLCLYFEHFLNKKQIVGWIRILAAISELKKMYIYMFNTHLPWLKSQSVKYNKFIFHHGYFYNESLSIKPKFPIKSQPSSK